MNDELEKILNHRLLHGLSDSNIQEPGREALSPQTLQNFVTVSLTCWVIFCMVLMGDRLVTVSNFNKKKKKVFLEMLELRTLIRKLLNSFQDDLYTCISSFSLSFFLYLPRTEELGGLQSIGLQRVKHD